MSLLPSHQHVVFLSDLHLCESQPHITALFKTFLRQCDNDVAAIYILGDLFEAWIGDDDHSPFHQEIIQAISAVTQKGIPVYFIHGNRDFFIGKHFLTKTGMQCLKDETVIHVFGTPVLLMHGDQLCTNDIAYQRARKILRNKILQYLFLRLPLSIRKKIATKARNKSMQHTRSTAAKNMDVDEQTVIKKFNQHQVNYLIHGHTHQPAFHEIPHREQTFMRIVLGAWHEKGHLLIWDQQDKKEMISF